MEQSTYTAFLRRWLWLLVVGLILGMGAGLVFRAAQPVGYQISATLEVNPSFYKQVLGSNGISQQTQADVSTAFASEVTTLSLLDAVSSDLSAADMALSPEQLGRMITATALAISPGATSPIGVKITVHSDKQSELGLIEQTVASNFTQQIAQEQEAEVTARINELSSSLDTIKSELDTSARSQQQSLIASGVDQLQDQLQVYVQLYQQTYLEYLDLTLGLGNNTQGGNMSAYQRTAELAGNLDSLNAKIVEDRQAIAVASATGGEADVENEVSLNIYRGLYQEYITLKSELPATAEQIFMPAKVTGVQESPRERIRNVVAIGGIGGLALAWAVAGGVDYIRGRRRSRV